ncbi:MAG: hypothetical protein IKX88_10880 [Thermoguttaceae bacterium]|nr:hypothetical protein [Thermoguttaceae bacterium]
MTKYLTTLCVCCLFALCFNNVYAQSPGVPWRAVDGLGRAVETSDELGVIRAGKSVGIFYFLWIDSASQKAPWTDGPYDVSKILERLPEKDLQDPEASKSELWAPHSQMHFWGEPLFGYYSAFDPWVLRRHVQLLADAGIDFLVFDTTNYLTYPDQVRALCDVMTQIRAEGGKTPQITFMLNTRAKDAANNLWNEVYSTRKYDELLFQVEGKPLLIGDPAEITDKKINAALTLRKAHWPFEMVNTQKAWHWEAAYPQPYGYVEDPNKPEQVNVSVAQNLSRQPDAHVQNMSSRMARGRSFCNGKVEEDLATDEGRNFAEQWKRAYELDPPYVMITGWNEWIAGRWDYGDGRGVFVDQYNREYSRDIEPMKGGHLDAYYMQMIEGIRRYKGVVPPPQTQIGITIDVKGSFAQWNNVETILTDWKGETVKRDFRGQGGTHYVNETGRNDFVAFKATRDSDNFYFYVKTAAPIQPALPDNLCVMIDVDSNLQTGFVGGDYLIGQPYDGTTASLAFFAGDNPEEWNWKQSGETAYKIENDELMIAVPYKALGLDAANASFNGISFKWSDNLSGNVTPAELYTTGDVAPESRFFFHVTE